MKLFVRSILITGTLALFASSSMIAQTSNSSFEQWYRGRYGRPSPTEQARLDTAAVDAASPDVAASPVFGSANGGFEQWYRAKYGRPSPTEEARLKSSQVDAAASRLAVAVSDDGGFNLTEPAGLGGTPVLSKTHLDALIAAAKTAAEHQTIAKDYRDRAQNYLAQAKKHAQMAEQFKKNPTTDNDKVVFSTVNHCEYFAQKFSDMAAKSQELAKQHEQMATEASAGSAGE